MIATYLSLPLVYGIRSAPNIAMNVTGNAVGCENYNTYVDNTMSLVNSPGTQQNSNYSGAWQYLEYANAGQWRWYGLELTIHYAEVWSQLFLKRKLRYRQLGQSPAKLEHSSQTLLRPIEYISRVSGPFAMERFAQCKNYTTIRLNLTGANTMNVGRRYGGNSNNMILR